MGVGFLGKGFDAQVSDSFKNKLAALLTFILFSKLGEEDCCSFPLAWLYLNVSERELELLFLSYTVYMAGNKSYTKFLVH